MTKTEHLSPETIARQAQVLAYECEFCWARPGQWCRTGSGIGSPDLHKRRWESWRYDQRVHPRLVAVGRR